MKTNNIYNYLDLRFFWGFPGGASGKEPMQVKCDRYGLDPWLGEILWRRAWQPIPVFLPRESHRQRNLAGCSPWGRKSQTRLSDYATTTKQGLGHRKE